MRGLSHIRLQSVVFSLYGNEHGLWQLQWGVRLVRDARLALRLDAVEPDFQQGAGHGRADSIHKLFHSARPVGPRLDVWTAVLRCPADLQPVGAVRADLLQRQEGRPGTGVEWMGGRAALPGSQRKPSAG